MKEKELPAGITQAMIDEARTKYGAGKVKMIDVLKDGSTDVDVTVLVAVPSRHVVSQYMQLGNTNMKKAEETMVKNCLLSHKDEVLADDELFYGVLAGLIELLPLRKAIIKNL